MGENLWSDLSAWMVERIEQAMGAESDYTTLPLQRVALAAVWDEREWSAWPMPAAVVIASSLRYGVGPHGDGQPHYDKRYPVVWLVLTQGSQAQAILDAQTLLKRMERLVADLTVGHDLAADAQGERLSRITVQAADMTAVRLPDAHDTWTIIGGLGLDFESET